jgi:hypothetical protein
MRNIPNYTKQIQGTLLCCDVLSYPGGNHRKQKISVNAMTEEKLFESL